MRFVTSKHSESRLPLIHHSRDLMKIAMKNIRFTSRRGTKFSVTQIPDRVDPADIRELLSRGKVCELEALGIDTVDYGRLITTPGIVAATVSDLLTALQLIYRCSRSDALIYIEQVTNETPDTVDAWAKGNYKMPRHHIKRVRDFIIACRQSRQ